MTGERETSYEPAVREDAKDTDITDVEKEKLLTGYGVDDGMFRHPFAAAMACGLSILRKWREAGDLTASPAEVEGKSEEEVIALKLIRFKNPADGIKTSKAVTKEERALQVTCDILANVEPHQSVKITEHVDGDGGSDDSDDGPSNSGSDGTAVRTGVCDSTDEEMWTVITSNGTKEITKADLLDPKQYYVHLRDGSTTSAEKRAMAARRSREHAHEKRRQEQEAKKLCHEERDQMLNGWFEEMNRRIAAGELLDRGTFDEMIGQASNKFSGVYQLRNNVTR